MKTAIALMIAATCSVATAADTPEQKMFGASIGSVIANDLREHSVDMGRFSWITVPVLDNDLGQFLYQANLFSDSRIHVVTGFRADRAVPTADECQRLAKHIDAILARVYPEPYANDGWRYKLKQYGHKAKDGPVIAGVRCEAKGPFSTLALEITDLSLEETLTK